MTHTISRRHLLKGLSIAPLAAWGVSAFGQEVSPGSPLKGNIRQAVCYGPYRSIPLDVFAPECRKIGLVGIDLVNPDEWETVMKRDLIVTLSRAPGASQSDAFNRLEFHDRLVELYGELIPAASKAGVKQMICFSGNRRGLSDEEGIANCITGLKRIMPLAEKHGVTLVMELFNDYDHKDYHAIHTAWGAEVAYGVGSEHFKLLYDIYHMQKSEGNLIDTIGKYKDVIGHYHTAGVPGRKDLDEEQEINYPAVMKAILRTGFKGYVAHEFSPKSQDKLTSLRGAVRVCDV